MEHRIDEDLLLKSLQAEEVTQSGYCLPRWRLIEGMLYVMLGNAPLQHSEHPAAVRLLTSSLRALRPHGAEVIIQTASSDGPLGPRVASTQL